MKYPMLLALVLGVSSCTTTKETRPKLILPTEANIKDAEARDWTGRIDGLRRGKQVSADDMNIQLVAVRDLQCVSMFESWAECSFTLNMTSDSKAVLSAKAFGQYSPKANGQWDSEIIMWHERRR